MANTQSMCSSFKQEILCGIHALGTSVVRAGTGADEIRAALYLTTPGALDATTTTYTTTNELTATGNYARGTKVVTNATQPSLSGTTAIWTPSAAISWAALTSSGIFNAVLIYNFTQGGASGKAISVHTFGDQSVSAGTFTLTMPSNDASNALIRIA